MPTETAKPRPSGKKAEPDDGLTQSERFIKAAQKLGTDDDPERLRERVRKLAKSSFEKDVNLSRVGITKGNTSE